MKSSHYVVKSTVKNISNEKLQQLIELDCFLFHYTWDIPNQLFEIFK